MLLRIAMPTLGRSPWWSDAVDSAIAIRESERVVVCPDVSKLSAGAGRVERDCGMGLYAAVNTGLRAAGEWSLGTYLNDDDRLVAAGVERARDVLESNREIGAVFGRVRMIDGDGARVTEIPVARRGADLGSLLAAGIVPLAQPGTIFRREMFEALGGFNESWRAAGDMEFFLRAWRGGWRFEFVDACVAEFRVHDGQISRQVAVVAAEQDRLVALARENQLWIRGARGAKWRFRLSNVAGYVARVRRHGLVSMESLYRTGGKA